MLLMGFGGSDGGLSEELDGKIIRKAASRSFTDVVGGARAVYRVELVHEAIAIGGRNPVGTDSQRITIDVPFAFGDGPLVVPEVM